jgi:hypothetical protein
MIDSLFTLQHSQTFDLWLLLLNFWPKFIELKQLTFDEVVVILFFFIFDISLPTGAVCKPPFHLMCKVSVQNIMLCKMQGVLSPLSGPLPEFRRMYSMLDTSHLCAKLDGQSRRVKPQNINPYRNYVTSPAKYPFFNQKQYCKMIWYLYLKMCFELRDFLKRHY